MTLLYEVPEDSRVVHYHMTDSLSLQRRQTDRLYCRALPLEAASLLHVVSILFAVNLCGRGQFAIDRLAHLGFKRIVSCSFRDKRMRLKARAYGSSRTRYAQSTRFQNETVALQSFYTKVHVRQLFFFLLEIAD